MTKYIKILISVITVTIMLFSVVVTYGANNSNEIKEKESQLEEGQKQEQSVSSQITDLENKISSAEESIAEAKLQITETQAKIKKISADVKKKKADLDKGTDDLNNRLRTMYKSGSVGFVDVILSSDNVSELLSNLEMVKRIYVGDKKVVGQLQKKYDSIRAEEKEMKELKATLDEKEKQLVAKEATLKDDKNQLSAKKENIVANNNQLQNEIDDLKAEADAIKDEIKNYDNGGNYSGGAMCWPVNGVVSCEYGWRNCPFHGRELHTGMDIACSYGQPVFAASSGTVQQAGPNGGYGNSVTITHGGGIATLYGHNSSVTVSPGQRVKKGQQIARAGSTGNSTGTHVHFEVRVNGNYVNPRNYL